MQATAIISESLKSKTASKKTKKKRVTLCVTVALNWLITLHINSF